MLNMHRPSDQAKLLLFALLRGTVSSLATEPKTAATVAGGVGLAMKTPPFLSSNIQLRLARQRDIPSIQRCNLATLPENYNSQFYANHLRQWPDLCLVAEETMGMDDNNNHEESMGGSMEPDGPFGSSFSMGSSSRTSNINNNNKREPNVVAYVLGKVEERRPPMPAHYYTEDYQMMSESEIVECDQDRFIGHVTSLAVLQPYRRKGVAAALMKQLHYHLEEAYGAGAVGLHVRKSNQAACRLYQNYGYQIDLTIPGYYQDGEDAYFMKKPLELPSPQAVAARQAAAAQQQQRGLVSVPRLPFGLGRSNKQQQQQAQQRPWESGPVDLRLPRDLYDEASTDDESADERTEEESPELLTGSM